MFNVQSASII